MTKSAGNCGIWSHLLKKSLMENLIFCAVLEEPENNRVNQRNSCSAVFFYIAEKFRKIRSIAPMIKTFLLRLRPEILLHRNRFPVSCTILEHLEAAASVTIMLAVIADCPKNNFYLLIFLGNVSTKQQQFFKSIHTSNCLKNF